MAMDLDHNPETMNMLTNTGFVSALYHATCLRPGSGCLAAPVCSSFVYMRLSTGRDWTNSPTCDIWFYFHKSITQKFIVYGSVCGGPESPMTIFRAKSTTFFGSQRMKNIVSKLGPQRAPFLVRKFAPLKKHLCKRGSSFGTQNCTSV